MTPGYKTYTRIANKRLHPSLVSELNNIPIFYNSSNILDNFNKDIYDLDFKPVLPFDDFIIFENQGIELFQSSRRLKESLVSRLFQQVTTEHESFASFRVKKSNDDSFVIEACMFRGGVIIFFGVKVTFSFDEKGILQFTDNMYASRFSACSLDLEQLEAIEDGEGEDTLNDIADYAGKKVVHRLVNICDPNKFIVSEGPAKQRPKRMKKLLPLHERDVYSILNIEEIRKKYKLGQADPDAEGRQIAFRRAHYRNFYHPRYINMKGKKIKIEAVWNGPNERIAKGLRYKVFTDR